MFTLYVYFDLSCLMIALLLDYVNVSGIGGQGDLKLIYGTRIVGMNHKIRKDAKVFYFLFSSLS